MLLVIAGQIVSGCTSLIPRRTSAAPLPNGVTEYRNPSFDNRISWLGWTFIGGITAAGAYQGHRSDLALRWTGWEQPQQVKPFGNAAIGAASGLVAGLLLTWITGKDPEPVTSDNAEEWLDKVDSRMRIIELDTLHPGIPLGVIRAMPRGVIEHGDGR